MPDRPPRRWCEGLASSGEPCRAAPLQDGRFCFMHDPERAAEAEEARKLGGLRRRREGTIGAAYELGSLETSDGIRRVLDIVVTDGLGLENGVNRLRVLISAAATATRLLAVADMDTRIQVLEGVVLGRAKSAPPTDRNPFD